MHFFKSLSGRQNLDEAFEQAKQMRAEVLDTTNIYDSSSKAINHAAGLMLDKQFEACIAAYREIAVRFPDRCGTCESQIGAAQFFLGRYDDAIAAYLAALELGEDRSMMDFNVFEACEALAEQTGDRAHYQRYLDVFPDGDEAKKARKRLAG